MYILSIHFGHDSSCAIIKDGEVLAAATEERFIRLKHYSLMPIRALVFCLSQSKITIDEIDLVVIPAMTTLPQIEVLLELKKGVLLFDNSGGGNKDISYFIKYLLIKLIQTLRQTTLIETPIYIQKYNASDKEVLNIEHHLAHAASAYYSSGFKEKTLVFTADGAGDGLSLTLWLGEENKLSPLMKVGREGSLGAFYSTVTEALG